MSVINKIAFTTSYHLLSIWLQLVYSAVVALLAFFPHRQCKVLGFLEFYRGPLPQRIFLVVWMADVSTSSRMFQKWARLYSSQEGNVLEGLKLCNTQDVSTEGTLHFLSITAIKQVEFGFLMTASHWAIVFC